MENHLQEELRRFENELIKMASLTEMAIHKSVKALKDRDKKLAEEVIVEDRKIDDLENDIEEMAIELLARFQPMARDLRFITTGMRITTELERIADLTVNISQRVIEMCDMPLLKPLIDIPKLAENAKRMVKDSIDAFVRRDGELAREVILSDRESNELRTIIMKELVYDYMVKDGTTAPRAVPLLLMARDLERMCDHATYIAEDVIYMIQAKIVKHKLKSLIDRGEEKS